MAASNSNSSSIFSTNHIYYLAPLLAVAIALTLFLPSFLGSSSSLSLQVYDKEDDVEIPINITTAVDSIGARPREAFADLKQAYDRWDSEIGCSRFRDKFRRWKVNESAVQQADDRDCPEFKLHHVSVWAKAVSWVPEVLDGLYECRCGLSCLWTRNEVLADQHDVDLYQAFGPPETVRFNIIFFFPLSPPTPPPLDFVLCSEPKLYENLLKLKKTKEPIIVK